jgi:predicted nuclease of predicted toxin-antitoxin system
LKILLDHNLDRRLKSEINGHEVATTFENGWADVENGELLSLAEANGFDVLLTADSNISKQQNLTGRKISIVVIRAFDNRRSTHIEMIDDVLKTLENVVPGTITEIFHRKFPQTK